MKRKQRTGESVSTYAQELEVLFEKSYGKREGMELASKELLKRDLFVQGLSLKWQEKVLPSAATFADALHQAQAATSRTHCWGNYTVGAHQISHHLQDSLSRIKVSEEENWRRDRTRGRPTLREEKGHKGATSVIACSTEPMSVRSEMLPSKHLAVIAADE